MDSGGTRRMLGLCFIGMAAGFGVALATALVMAVWAWIENPSGIFHGPEGTNWRFVWDTAVSWFLPVLAYAAPATLALSGLVHLRRRNRSRSGSTG